MLFHGRIAKSNRMLPFTTQIIEVVAAHYPANVPSPAELAETVAQQAQDPTEAVPVRDPNTGQAETAHATGTQLTQQTAFPGLQASPCSVQWRNAAAFVQSLHKFLVVGYSWAAQ